MLRSREIVRRFFPLLATLSTLGFISLAARFAPAGEIRVPAGATLSKIAEKEIGPTVYDPKLGSLPLLLRSNPGIKDPARVLEGTVLVLPDPEVARQQREAASMRWDVSDGEYRAKKGDTLSGIAREKFHGPLYGPSDSALKRLLELNPGLKSDTRLHERQLIRYPASGEAKTAVAAPVTETPVVAASPSPSPITADAVADAAGVPAPALKAPVSTIANLTLAELQANKLPIDAKGRDTNREVALTFIRVHISAGEDAAAAEVAASQLRDDPDDAGTWNALGLVHLKQEENLLASNAFLHAVELSYGELKGAYLYNHADASNRLGHEADARRSLASAATVENLAESAQYALRTLSPRSPLPPLRIQQPGKWSASAAVSSGYDSNVVLASDTSLETLSRSDVASATVLAAVQGGYVRPFASGDLRTNGAAAFNYNTSASAQTFNSLSLSMGGTYGATPAEDDHLSLRYGPRASTSFVNTSGLQFFNASFSAALSGAYRLSTRDSLSFELPVGYDTFASGTGAVATNIRTGPNFGAGGVYQRLVGRNQLTGGLRYQYKHAQGINFRGAVISLPLTWARVFSGGVFVGAGLAGELTRYPSSATGRRDINTSLTASAGKKFADHWTGVGALLAQKSTSTDATARYTKATFSLLVSYEIY